VATNAESVALAANSAVIVANNALKAAGAAARVASLTASIAEARATIANTVSTIELSAARAFLERSTWRLAAAQATLAESTAIVTAAQSAGAVATGAATGGFAAMALSMGKIALIAAAVTAAVIGINEAIKFAFNFDPIDAMATKLEKLVTDTFPSLASAINKVGEFFGMAAPPSQRGKEAPVKPEDTQKTTDLLKEQEDVNRKIQDALEKQRKEISMISGEFKKQLGDRAAALKFETSMVGKSEKQKSLETALFDLRKKTADEVDRITKARDTLGPDQKKLVGDYNAQIAAVKTLGKTEETRLTNLVNGLTAAKQAQEIVLFQTRETGQAFEDLAKIEKDIAQIGFGEQAKGIMDVAFAADERARAEIRALEASRNEKLGEEEKAKIFAISKASTEALTDATNKLADAKEKFAQKESLRLFDLKTEYDLQDKLLTLQREVADIGLTDIEKKYRDITRAADDSAKAAVRAEEERRSAIAGTRVTMSPAEVDEYYKRARAGSEDLVRSQKKLYDSSRTFQAGWKGAFASYIDNAKNAAKSAERVFEKFTSGLEDALVGFAKTGKFEWKNFVADMAEELLRSQIKSTLASVLQIENPFSSGGSSIGDSLGGLFGGLLGGSGGATRGQSANSPMFVYDVAGGGGAGGGGILGGIMGPQQQGGSGGGIMGTIGNIFSGVKDAVGGVFSGIGDAVGGVVDSIGSIFSGGGSSGGGGGFLDSIVGGIGDLFGGFFAGGGNIPAGKFGMVGENGPELIGGPAGITPMGGSTAVTYNIQAVDARSFQQLLASDPSFIFALTEQGRKSFAGAR
jgi:lambda family phage tail tape measure protein